MAELGSRALFPALKYPFYLAHAAVSPLSLRVQAAVSAHMQCIAERGAGAVEAILAQRERLRELLGRLFGVSAGRIALTSGTTMSITAVAQCFPWQPGDRLLLLRGEFPTNVTPWQRAAQRFDLDIEWMQAEDFRGPRGLEILEQHLRKGLRLMAVSAVSFQTGLRLPLKSIADLCHAHGAQLSVDAIQAAGIVPLDAPGLGVDFLMGGSHKWLMSVEGTGYLYVAPGIELRPELAGWLSHQEPIRFLLEKNQLRYDRDFLPTPRFLEMGTMNSLGGAALEASLEILLELSVPSIFQHVNAYLDLLEPQLLDLGLVSWRGSGAQRSGILSLSGDCDMDRLRRALDVRGVCCSCPDGQLRLAPHWPNALQEVDCVSGHIRDCLRA